MNHKNVAIQDGVCASVVFLHSKCAIVMQVHSNWRRCVKHFYCQIGYYCVLVYRFIASAIMYRDFTVSRRFRTFSVGPQSRPLGQTSF